MLTVHLWKEWREQRLLLGAIVLALIAASVGFGLLAPARMVPSDIEVWFVMVALGAGFIALAGDLVPGEQRRGQFAFLLRTPGALRTSFVAKILLLAVGLAALLGIGWGLGGLCLELAGGRGLPDRVETLGHAPIVIRGIAIGVGVCAPWAFAVSCWMPRGASVVPATALTIAVVAAPAVLVAATYAVPVSRTEMIVAIVLVFLGGLLAAWLSFVRGLRFGRRMATALHGLAAVTVFVLPSWIWSAERVHTWRHADPGDRDMLIGAALLGADGHTAFVSLKRDWGRHGPVYSVLVDLDDGSFDQLGPAQGWFFGVGALERNEFLTGLSSPQALVGRYQLGNRGQEIVERALIDGQTGRVIATLDEWRIPDRYREGITAASRATTPFRLPNGDRAWFDGRSVVFEGPDGSREAMPWPDGARPGLAVGFGFHWLGGDGKPTGEILDLGRRRNVRAPDGLAWTSMWVRPGSWVLRAQGRERPHPERWNPDSGDRNVLELPPGAEIQALAGDGRLILVDDDDTFLLDPDSGVRQDLVVANGGRIDGVGPADWRIFRVPTLTPGGADVHQLWFPPERRRSFARRDGARLLSTLAVDDDLELVAIPDEDHVLVIRDRRSIERWHFGSDRVEVLFVVGGAVDARAAPRAR